MAKFYIYILFLFLSKLTLAQRVTFEDLRAKNKIAKANSIKSIKEFSFKNDKCKKGKLIFEENYDANNNVINSTGREHYRFRHFVDSTYCSYDTSGRIQKIYNKVSWVDDGHGYYSEYHYNDNNQISYIVGGFGLPEKVLSDTVRYSYLEDGKINFKLVNKEKFGFYTYDTSYYHYGNGFIYVSDKKIDSMDSKDYSIRNQYGCIVGYNELAYEKYSLVCDSQCNVLKSKGEIQLKNKWVIIDSSASKYSGQHLVEEKRYKVLNEFVIRGEVHSRKIKLKDGKAKLELNYWKKYEYNENGLIMKEISYNRKGKIIGVKKYVYETLP